MVRIQLGLPSFLLHNYKLLVRQYQQIWSELKEKGVVSITANRLHHPRILKAVKKEKWMDIGYKISIEPKVAVLGHSRKHSILTFRLTHRIYHLSQQDLGLEND